MPIRFVKYRYLKQRRKHRYIPITPPYTHCKNCGNELHAQYCSVCGQFAHLDNRPFGESLAFYLEHHYGLDHKLGRTLHNLFFKPGFLTKEYIKGRIYHYVHPFKIYFFSSILFFGVALGVASKDDKSKDEKINLDIDKDPVKDAKTGEKAKSYTINFDTDGSTVKKINKADSAKVAKALALKNEKVSEEEEEDESAFETVVTELIENKFNGKTKHEMEQMLYHNISLSMLLLMPIFALLLKLVYIRRKFPYMNHFVHSIHLHSVFFILTSTGLLWDTYIKTPGLSGWMILATFIYLVVSLSKFYNQGWMKSLAKAFLLIFVYLFVCLFGLLAALILLLVF